MRPRPTAMLQDVGARAASFFQGVGEDRHAGEVAALVHLLGETRDCMLTQPSRIDDCGRMKGVGYDVTKKESLQSRFLIDGGTPGGGISCQFVPVNNHVNEAITNDGC